VGHWQFCTAFADFDLFFNNPIKLISFCWILIPIHDSLEQFFKVIEILAVLIYLTTFLNI